MNNYEQLVEFIINDETDKARELFHDIVVKKSRDIYESLMDEEVGGNEVEDLAKDIQCDETGLAEEEDHNEAEMGDDEDSDMDNDFDDSGDLDDHEEDHADVEDRVQDLESALDELKAEFDALMSGEDKEPEMFGNDTAEEEELEDEMDGSIVREYVEKVAAPSNTAVKSTSPVADKNDMGGSAKNIAQGGEETGSSAEKAQDIKSGNINVPGGKAGNAFTTKEKASEA